MQKATHVSLAILLAAAGLTTLAPPAAATVTVDVCAVGCSFTSVVAAVAASGAGDTVLVRPGTYVGSVTINVPLTLCGGTATSTGCSDNAENVIIEGNNIYPIFIDANDVVLRGVTVRNPTFTATGFVDPSLVVVFGDDRVQILNNILENPTAPLLPGESRWYTIGVNIATGSDDVTVRGNTLRNFASGIGPGAVCSNAPCAVVGVFNWGGGSGFVVDDNELLLGGTGTSRSTGVRFTNNPGVVITDNLIRMAGSPPGDAGHRVIAIETSTSANGVLVEGNDIAVALGETPYGLYGAFGVFSNSIFRDNEIRNAQHGLMLRTSSTGNNLVEDNTFIDNGQGVLNFARATTIRDNTFSLQAVGVFLDSVGYAGSSENVVLRENVFRDTGITLSIASSVSGVYVDARENDWGEYSADSIRFRQNDDAGTNDVDIRCFIDADGSTRVCPDAQFTAVRSGTTWPRTVTLDDNTVSPRAYTRVWTLPGGGSSSAEIVTLQYGPGAYTFTLDVEDENGFTDSATTTVILTNAAPTGSLLASYPAAEGSPFALSGYASDIDGDTLTYTLTSGPAGMTINAATGAISWTPGYTQAGTHAVSVSFTDGLASGSASTSVVVSNTPVGPILHAIAPRTVSENALVTGTITTSSPGGTIPVFTTGALPVGMSFVDNNDGTATYSWTPGTGTTGTYVVAVTATTEGIGASGNLVINVANVVGVRVDRVSPSVVASSPGASVPVTARVVNTGSGSDTYTITVTPSKPWATTSIAPVALAAGASADVTTTVTLPADADVAFVTIRACSTLVPTTCSEQRTRVDAPILVSLTITSASISGGVQGEIKATYLDGSPVKSAQAIFSQTSGTGINVLSSATEGTTDDAGVFAFVADDPRARAPGQHGAYATVRKGSGQGSASGSYFAFG